MISASEIPEARALASPVPDVAITINVVIIPDTVPRSPSSGAMLARIAQKYVGPAEIDRDRMSRDS